MAMTVVAVGDVLVNRMNPSGALTGIRPLLDAADVTFGNLEGVFTDLLPVVPGALASSLVGTHNARGLAGLRVVSLANNHAMDAGRPGLTSTLQVLSDEGIAATGAGPTLADALRPAVLEHDGLRVAFLAVTAVLQHGAEARVGTPGVAPLRAEDCYLPPYQGVCTPGVPPRVVSILNEADWAATEAAVGRARDLADLVVVSVHWGDHTRPWLLTDHERLCAELLVEAGATLVLGHHQHMLRGVEVIGATPVFFGLSHVTMDYPGFTAELADYGIQVTGMSPAQLTAAFGEHGIYPRADHPDFPFPPEARRTGVAVIVLSGDGVDRVGLVPCLIGDDGVARPVARGTADWARAVDLLGHAQEVPELRTKALDAGWVFGGCDVVEFARPTG